MSFASITRSDSTSAPRVRTCKGNQILRPLGPLRKQLTTETGLKAGLRSDDHLWGAITLHVAYAFDTMYYLQVKGIVRRIVGQAAVHVFKLREIGRGCGRELGFWV